MLQNKLQHLETSLGPPMIQCTHGLYRSPWYGIHDPTHQKFQVHYDMAHRPKAKEGQKASTSAHSGAGYRQTTSSQPFGAQQWRDHQPLERSQRQPNNRLCEQWSPISRGPFGPKTYPMRYRCFLCFYNNWAEASKQASISEQQDAPRMIFTAPLWEPPDPRQAQSPERSCFQPNDPIARRRAISA